MNRSETITKLAIALVKFNAEVSSIAKDAKNPFFKSEYVTLDNLIIHTRPILQKNGLVVMQSPLSREDGSIGIQTLLIHESGEYIESEPIYMKPAKQNDPQAAGSVISYMRRYSYQAILNLNTGEDDDGNNASPMENKQQTKNNLSEAQLKRLYAIASKKGYSADKVKAAVIKKFGVDVALLNKAQYDQVVSGYEGLEDK